MSLGEFDRVKLYDIFLAYFHNEINSF